jgi:DeoR/GlpR family transcriptional regulator of sugar metabolism
VLQSEASRSDAILQELLRTGEVRVVDLSRRFEVDASTVRRDLEKLERHRLLKRVHGGAVLADALNYSSFGHDLVFQSNMGQLVEEKTRIALAAAQLIQPGDTIALSTGTTVAHLARAIRHLQISDLTVVTNAVNVAMELAGLRNLNLIVTGGMVLPDFFAMVGPLAEQSLMQMYTSKTFIGVAGISLEHGLTVPNPLQALAHRTFLERARQTIVLADHSKLGHVALYRLAPVNAMNTLITDKGDEEVGGVLDSLRTMKVEVIEA